MRQKLTFKIILIISLLFVNYTMTNAQVKRFGHPKKSPSSLKLLKHVEKKVDKTVKDPDLKEVEGDEHDKYDGPAEAAKFEFECTKDPATGQVPKERLLKALDKTIQMRRNNQNGNSPQVVLNWIERGPNSDSTGPSNGNTRANNAVTSGRIRGVCVDSVDLTRKTVWVAGTTGGIWKTTDITVSPANWTIVNDFMVNLSVTAICQNPANPNVMYACTGEDAFNGGLVRGVGVFKSTDHGVTWNLLASTSTFIECTRVLCDPAGGVYLATKGTGLQRSGSGLERPIS